MAESLGISVDEAYWRMTVQPGAGVLGARLEQNEASWFGGLYIEQFGDFGIMVLTTTSTPNIREHLSSGLSEVEIACRTVDFTLRELSKGHNEFSRLAPPTRFDSWIDTEANRIVLNAASEEDADILREAVNDGQFTVPTSAFTIQVGPLAQPG